MADAALLRRTLRDSFGYDDFRPGQRVVVESVLTGRHTLAVMPTGAGKSLCYQLPPLVSESTDVVVSPFNIPSLLESESLVYL